MARQRRKPRGRPSVIGTPLPAALLNRLQATLGPAFDQFLEAMDRPPPVSVRLNPAKPGGPQGRPIPWCTTGHYLEERPLFTLDPLLHAGAYYVQEASSMLLEQALRTGEMTDRPVVALDLCAAPGGKSTHLRSLLHQGSLLLCNETDPHRRNILMENLWKWGQPGVMVSGGQAADFNALTACFDLVLVDAPCSGEGLMRREPMARTQWDPALVMHCAALQRGILHHAWHALKPGGLLIYSTCTWEPQENEEQLLPLVAQGGIPLDLEPDPAWGVERIEVQGAVGFRCMPHRVQGEGFFIAAMRKPAVDGARSERTAIATMEPAPPEVAQWLAEPEAIRMCAQGDALHAVPEAHAALAALFMKCLPMAAPGVPVAMLKAGRWRPHPALALSMLCRREAFRTIEMDHEQALHHLRGNAMPAHAATGTALARHQGLPLGWMHGAGNRWNNAWPAPWRIRMHPA